MASTVKSSTKSTSNSKKTTTLIYSKSSTIFGTTEDSLFIIKEHKYEVKKIPIAVERNFSDTEKTTTENYKEKTSSLNTEIPIETAYDKNCEAKQSEQKKMYSLKESNKDDDEILSNQYAKEKTANPADEVQQISKELDAVFQYRILDIESKTPHDLVLKIRTYQEWVETLLKRNEAAIKLMKSLKEELADCIEMSAIDTDMRLRSYRDRDVLVRFIQEAFHDGVWNLDYLQLETLTLAEFLKRDLNESCGDSSPSQVHSSPITKKQKQKRNNSSRSS